MIIAAPVALVQAIWRSSVAQEQAATASRALQEGSFQKASEMLGSHLSYVRLGGIYALRQLARDDPGEFHLRVVRLLAAFIRNTPTEKTTQRPPGTESGHGGVSICREEIQVILVFLGERTVEGWHIEKKRDWVIDLQGSDLRRIWLSESASLEGVRLSYANLSGAEFSDVKGLSRSRLVGVYSDPDDDPQKFTNVKDWDTCEPLKWPLNG